MVDTCASVLQIHIYLLMLFKFKQTIVSLQVYLVSNTMTATISAKCWSTNHRSYATELRCFVIKTHHAYTIVLSDKQHNAWYIKRRRLTNSLHRQVRMDCEKRRKTGIYSGHFCNNNATRRDGHTRTPIPLNQSSIIHTIVSECLRLWYDIL